MIDITKPMRVKGTHEPAKVVFVDEMMKNGKDSNKYLVVKQGPVSWLLVKAFDGFQWCSLRDLDRQLENIPEEETPPQASQPPQEEAPLPSIPSAAEMAQRAKEAQEKWIREELITLLQEQAALGRYEVEVHTRRFTEEVYSTLVESGYTLDTRPEENVCTISWHPAPPPPKQFKVGQTVEFDANEAGDPCWDIGYTRAKTGRGLGVVSSVTEDSVGVRYKDNTGYVFVWVFEPTETNGDGRDHLTIVEDV